MLVVDQDARKAQVVDVDHRIVGGQGQVYSSYGANDQMADVDELGDGCNES